MATLRQQDRLQPALLDRLTDDEPGSKVEAVESRVINRQRLREMVLRDLGWLFNATQPTGEIDWAAVPEAETSVINYGLPPLSGRAASSIDPGTLRLHVREAIIRHEPRILADTLVVEVVVKESQLDHHNQIGIRINGQMWAQPVPLELMLHTDIDLETGRVAVREASR
jgi:type VI secretion system protein ImpF